MYNTLQFFIFLFGLCVDRKFREAFFAPDHPA